MQTVRLVRGVLSVKLGERVALLEPVGEVHVDARRPFLASRERGALPPCQG